MAEPRKKPDWYRKTIHRFTDYPADLIRLENMKSTLSIKGPSITAKLSAVQYHAAGTTSDQAGNLATEMADLEGEIRELETIIQQTERVIGYFGKEEKKLIEMKYLTRFSKDWHVAKELNMPMMTYYRFKDRVIGESAVMFGFVKRDQISLWESKVL